MCEYINYSLIDSCHACDYTIAGMYVLIHSEIGAFVGDKHIKLFKTTGINQEVNPFTGSKFALSMLFLNAFGSAAQEGSFLFGTQSLDWLG